MSARDLAVVVLAAGKGTRLKSALAKVLHRAGGRPLVEHVVRACLPLKAAGVFVVVGYQAEDVRAVVEPLGAKVVVQEPQRGTGHALQVARKPLGRAKYALVVPGDAPLVRIATLEMLVRAHRKGHAAATILSAMLDDPTGYGRIIRKKNGRAPDGAVAGIVEEKALRGEQRGMREVNSSIYCFTLDRLWPCLGKLRPENVHRELYLTDAIALLDHRGDAVRAQLAPDAQEILGCNTRAELAEVDRILRQRKRAALMEAGVTIYLPETVLIDPDVEVGADTVIEPNVQLLGVTRVGARCSIRTGSVVSDSLLADGVTVRQHSIVAASRLGAGVVVGPFAHLRDGAELRPQARVGNFVEVKKSVLHEGVKAMHLTYIGDASVGRESNIGAGTITCNYDGVRKNPTTIGDRVFVGSGTELVAPVTVGDGVYIAAGSTITDDVPADALAIARERQVIRPGWAAEQRAQRLARGEGNPDPHRQLDLFASAASAPAAAKRAANPRSATKSRSKPRASRRKPKKKPARRR